MQEREFTPRTLAFKLGVKPAAASRWITTMLERGMVEVMLAGSGSNPTVYQFVRPNGGSAPRPKVAPPEVVVAKERKRVRHNISTRKTKTGNKRSQELVRLAHKAGAQVRIKGNNHVEVMFNGQREALALTPSNGSARADRQKLSKMGIQ